MKSFAVIYRPESLRFVAGPFEDLAARAHQAQVLRWESGAGDPWILVGSADSEESAVRLVKEVLRRLKDSKALPPVVSLELHVCRDAAPPKG